MHGLRHVLLLGVVSAHLAAAASEPPLPDKDQFVAEVRARLRTDRALQAHYTFTERRQEIEVSKLGKVSADVTKTYEVYPSADPGFTYKRLIAVNGKAIPADELARNDEKHRQDVERVAASPSERVKRQQDIERNVREEREAIDELFRVYDIHLVGRETLAGLSGDRRHARSTARVPAAIRRRPDDEDDSARACGSTSSTTSS